MFHRARFALSARVEGNIVPNVLTASTHPLTTPTANVVITQDWSVFHQTIESMLTTRFNIDPSREQHIPAAVSTPGRHVSFELQSSQRLLRRYLYTYDVMSVKNNVNDETQTALHFARILTCTKLKEIDDAVRVAMNSLRQSEESTKLVYVSAMKSLATLRPHPSVLIAAGQYMQDALVMQIASVALWADFVHLVTVPITRSSSDPEADGVRLDHWMKKYYDWIEANPG
eukprot:PhF_6_TR35015/c0_g2_i2/m.50956